MRLMRRVWDAYVRVEAELRKVVSVHEVKIELIGDTDTKYQRGIRIQLGEKEDRSQRKGSKYWLDLDPEEALKLAEKLMAFAHSELREERRKRLRATQ